MFLDAFVCTEQCLALLDGDGETALFICFHHYVKNGQTFSVEDALEDYAYRRIQKDSVRCLLLYLPITMKRYLVDVCKRPAESVVPSEVGQNLIRKMKLIKFALYMLNPNDLHIKQVAISLGALERYAKDMMEFCGCYDDYKKILN
jgi:hypothetical protein